MISLAASCGVEAVRDGRNHGGWVGGRKLGSIGIAFHGLALYVNLSLSNHFLGSIPVALLG